MSHLTPTPIVDKNGVATTRNKNLTEKVPVERTKMIGKPMPGVIVSLEGEHLTVPQRYNPNLAGAGVHAENGTVVVTDPEAVVARFFRTTKDSLPEGMVEFISARKFTDPRDYTASTDGTFIEFRQDALTNLLNYAYEYPGTRDSMGLYDFVRSQGFPTEGDSPSDAVTNLVLSRAYDSGNVVVENAISEYSIVDIRPIHHDLIVPSHTGEIDIAVPTAGEGDDLKRGIWGVLVRDPNSKGENESYILVAGQKNYEQGELTSYLVID
jgi:hypothetical protein